MGEVPIDQWWMAIPSVYGQRGQTGQNRQTIIDYFWALCWKHQTVFDEAVQESFILANLLPYVRSNGSRRVLADAHLAKPKRMDVTKQDLIEELDRELKKHRGQELELTEFRDHTAVVLGPPRIANDVRQEYDRFAQELLEEGRSELERVGEPALDGIAERWLGWMKYFGRHRGHENQKAVLDILSYESRSALHRCYSAVWCDLLPRLTLKYSLSSESVAFHQLWHFDQCEQAVTGQASRFHLFHGHILGLHPGVSIFISTEAGTELLGECLKNPGLNPEFYRLLYGIYLGMDQYARLRKTHAFLRVAESNFATGFDLEAEEATQVSQSKHRRLPGVREDEDEARRWE